MLKVLGLRKSFGGRAVLSGADFAAEGGGSVFIGGENGAGKTTFLKIVAGLLAEDSAQKWEFDSAEGKPPRGAGGAVLLHQEPFMFASTVRANVEFAAASVLAAERALEWAGLSGIAGRPARGLSGGERARVSLARARAAMPKLCLLDEPLARMDGAGGELLSDFILEFTGGGGLAVLAGPSPPGKLEYGAEWRLSGGILRRV